MKTKLLLSLILVLAFGFSASGQTRGMTGLFGVNTSFASLNGRSEFDGYEIIIGNGYRFNPKFALRLQAEMAIGHFKVDSVKSYENNGTLGVAADYTLLRVDSGMLAISTALGSTLGGSDWSYMYFDGGLKYAFGRDRIKMCIGVGLRYYDSYKSRFSNTFNSYVSLGFFLN